MLVFGSVALVAGLVGLVAHYYAPGSLYTLALAALSGYLGLGALVALILFLLVRTPAGWAGAAASALVVVWLVSSMRCITWPNQLRCVARTSWL